MIPEAKIFFIAMSPILELRGAIPIGLEIYKLSPLATFSFSVLGNLVPGFFLILFLEKVAKFLSKNIPIFKNFFDWWFQKIQQRHQKKFERWGKLALLILVAIPLPLTGVWTASVCAFLFKIPFKSAILFIGGGVLIAGILVLSFSLGVCNLI